METALDHLSAEPRRALGLDAGRQLGEAIRMRLEAKTRATGCRLGDLSATLLAVIVLRWREGVRWQAFHVGDGLIAGNLGGGAEVVSAPENGEFANETVFVTSEHLDSRLRCRRGGGRGASFLLMTDGASTSLYRRSDRALAPGVASLLGWPERASSLRLRDALRSSIDAGLALRTQDDVTLALGACALARRRST